MVKKLIVKPIMLFMVFAMALFIQPESSFCQDIFQKTIHAKYNIMNSVTIHNENVDLSKLAILMPLAQTNQYQVINNLNCNGGEILDIPETDDKYVRFVVEDGDLPEKGQSKSYGYEFDVEQYKIIVDFDLMNTIYPYDTSSDIYQWYTGTSGDLVDPYNTEISSISDSIWIISDDIINYAERCYDYVASNFEYLNPLTGLHPLTKLLEDGGGDCGNLQSIFHY